MKDKIVILIGMVSIVISCNKPIYSLEMKKLKYQELPKVVKEKTFDLYSDFSEEEKEKIYYSYSFRELNKHRRYEYYTKQDFFFPWIYEGYIENKKIGRVYSLKKKSKEEMGNQYIVYGDSLYIPNHYNIYAEDSLSYTFTRFILK